MPHRMVPVHPARWWSRILFATAWFAGTRVSQVSRGGGWSRSDAGRVDGGCTPRSEGLTAFAGGARRGGNAAERPLEPGVPCD